MLHNNELISVEEASYHVRPNCSVRRFTLKNNLTGFQVTIKATGASVISCKTNKDELIRADNDENQQANSIRNPSVMQLQNQGFEWQSHVLGPDSISFATNVHHNSTITYQLNERDELLMLGKLRNLNHLNQMIPFFFNLNSSNSSVDGHFLHIKAIRLDKFDQDSENQSLSINLSNSDATNSDFSSFFKSPTRINWPNSQDKKVHDLVYTLTGKYKEASIFAILSYGSRRIEFTLQNTANGYSSQFAPIFTQMANSSGQTLNPPNSLSNLCKLRVKISQNGVSLVPTNMTDFKCTYKFY